MPTSSHVVVIDGISYTVVSHYTGSKDIDRVIREIAEKQALADMSSQNEKKKRPRHKLAELTISSLLCHVLCGIIKAHTNQAALT